MGTDFEAASAFFVEAFAPDNRANPYPLYARMREMGSVVSTDFNLHLAFSHEACWSIVRNPLASSDERRGTLFRREADLDPRLAAQFDVQPSLVFLDPPDHTRLRSLVASAFTPRRTELLRADIHRVTDHILDAVAEDVDAGGSTIDVIERLAYPVPIMVICDMLGVPSNDQPRFHDWSSALTRSVDPGILRSDADNTAIANANLEIGNYVADLISERRTHPSDDLVTALLAASDRDDQLQDSEVVDLVVLLLIAGHETTVNLIGNGLSALLDRPEVLADLGEHPELTETAVDELLRYDSPLQMVQRIAITDLTIGDQRIPAGDQIIVMLGAANRDPAVFITPDRLDIRRPNANRHVSFGGGIHHCLGATLARTEGAIVLSSLLARFTKIEPAGEPTLRNTFNLRGRSHLPVTLAHDQGRRWKTRRSRDSTRRLSPGRAREPPVDALPATYNQHMTPTPHDATMTIDNPPRTAARKVPPTAGYPELIRDVLAAATAADIKSINIEHDNTYPELARLAEFLPSTLVEQRQVWMRP